MTKGRKTVKNKPILWTPAEAAQYWRIKVRTVYAYIREHKIDFITVGRSYRIPNEQVAKGIPRE